MRLKIALCSFHGDVMVDNHDSVLFLQPSFCIGGSQRSFQYHCSNKFFWTIPFHQKSIIVHLLRSSCVLIRCRLDGLLRYISSERRTICEKLSHVVDERDLCSPLVLINSPFHQATQSAPGINGKIICLQSSVGWSLLLAFDEKRELWCYLKGVIFSHAFPSQLVNVQGVWVPPCLILAH